MKVTGARSEPFSGIRRRALVKAGAASASSAAARADSALFLGVPESEMTPAVQAALQALAGEVDDLRGEVSRLKARLAEAEGLADRDGLTPLLNRRAFLRELGRVRTFAERYGAPASLVYFDLDGFKAINDRYGHAAGDAALQAVAERLAANVRESDILGRLGGDEFALVLVQADAPTAQAKAAALAEVVEREPIRFGEWTAPVRLSWGVTEISADVETDALVAQADAAMFAAKRLRKAG
jgi:diguanylate cyclase (GGDEF)-like protein